METPCGRSFGRRPRNVCLCSSLHVYPSALAVVLSVLSIFSSRRTRERLLLAIFWLDSSLLCLLSTFVLPRSLLVFVYRLVTIASCLLSR